MNKLQMAHEWYMKHSESPNFMYTEVDQAWQYADAMQAEVDKRTAKCDEKIEINMYPEWDASINYPPDAWVMYHGEKRLAVSIKDEWQPDWSQAPRCDVVAWDINEHGQARWIASDNGYYLAPSFNYQGDWRDSLRKRPQ